MWGEILTAGASIIGSLFGKKSSTVKSSVDYDKMMHEASAAGFNPLTALRNGGSAGFTTTTSPTVSQMPEALANLGGVLGNALDKKLDPIEAKKRELDTALVDAQLSALKKGAMPAGLYQPRTFEGTKVSQQLVPRLGAASTKQAANVPAAYVPQNPNLKAGDPPEASDIGLNNGRYGWFDPGVIPDAGGAISQAYGEPGEWIGGAVKAATAIPYTVYRNGKSVYEDYKSAQERERKREAVPEPRVAPGGWMGRARTRTRVTTRHMPSLGTGRGGGW